MRNGLNGLPWVGRPASLEILPIPSHFWPAQGRRMVTGTDVLVGGGISVSRLQISMHREGAMNYYSFKSVLNVRCGFDAIDRIGSELFGLSYQKVFIVTDNGIGKSGILKRLENLLGEKGVKYEVFTEVEPNPRDTTVERAWAQIQDADMDAVIGIGGGSSIDVAKGVAVLGTNEGPIAQYDGPDKVKNLPLPIIAIPTTAGTGSEVTTNAAITNTQTHYKMSIRSPLIIPKLSILDPSLLQTLPAKIAGETGMDAFIHAVEGFVSNRATPISDAFAIEAIRMIAKNIRPFVANRANPEAAESMLIGSMLAGMVIGNTGTGNAHALGRAMGGFFDTPHGLACAFIFPAVVKFNYNANPSKYRLVAEALGVSTRGKPDSKIRNRLTDELAHLSMDLNIPTRLSEIGIPEDTIPKIAEVALQNTGPNPRTTTLEDLVGILKEAS